MAYILNGSFESADAWVLNEGAFRIDNGQPVEGDYVLYLAARQRPNETEYFGLAYQNSIIPAGQYRLTFFAKNVFAEAPSLMIETVIGGTTIVLGRIEAAIEGVWNNYVIDFELDSAISMIQFRLTPTEAGQRYGDWHVDFVTLSVRYWSEQAFPAKQYVLEGISSINTQQYTEGLEYADTEDFALNGYTAQALRGEHWDLCSICNCPKPRSRTVVVNNRRICKIHTDDPSVRDGESARAARLRNIFLAEARSRQKRLP